MNKLPKIGEVYRSIDGYDDVVRVKAIEHDESVDDYVIHFDILEDPQQYWLIYPLCESFYVNDFMGMYELLKYYDTKLYKVLNL